jgi:hypothetical protein
MDALDGAAGNRVCTGCHTKYDNVIALEAHAHHRADGAGGVCMNCHMPKKNMSLDTRLTRYHRIGSPDDPAHVERDRPLECSLCHADQSVGALVERMEAWWGRRYDRTALVNLYGSLAANPLEVALAVGKAHEQAVAIVVLGQARARAAVPQLAAQLTHPLPIVRYYAVRALEQVLGTRSPIDLEQPNERIRADAARWLGVAAPAAPASATDGED